jgi:hypothetical protein
MESFSADLGDREHRGPNISQASRIYHASGKTEDEFIGLLYRAKEIARGATNIRKRNSQGEVNRMPYFFKVLRDLISGESDSK